MSAQDLTRLAMVNYGHFTSMRVTDGRVRGLARHLERLDRDARILFGGQVPEDVTRRAVREATAGKPDIYARVTVFARDFDARAPERDLTPDVVVTTGGLPSPDAPPLRVRTAGYQRELPQVKHVSTFGLFYQRRLARQAGFDDVVFVTPDGQVCEGSTWNISFLAADGTIVWPSAPALPGIAMGLVQSGLTRSGRRYEVRPVPLSELPDFRAAFASNALSPVRQVGVIDDVKYEPADDTAAMLLACHDMTPEERV